MKFLKMNYHALIVVEMFNLKLLHHHKCVIIPVGSGIATGIAVSKFLCSMVSWIFWDWFKSSLIFTLY
ncbi:hypothetical protein AC241_31365 (plasmid) [Bacillus thuringiensis]|nr:hypothetical protein AC241_31365 [Bacillus thuringiensis]